MLFSKPYFDGSVYTTQDIKSVRDAKTLISNSHLIITHIKMLHCNILNYMPLYMARIIVNFDYDSNSVRDTVNGIKVIYENELYDIDNLSIDKFSNLRNQVVKASAMATFPTDNLEMYVVNNIGGV